MARQRLSEVAQAEFKSVPECYTYSSRNLMLSPNFQLTWELKQLEKNECDGGGGHIAQRQQLLKLSWNLDQHSLWTIDCRSSELFHNK